MVPVLAIATIVLLKLRRWKRAKETHTGTSDKMRSLFQCAANIYMYVYANGRVHLLGRKRKSKEEQAYPFTALFAKRVSAASSFGLMTRKPIA